MINSGKTDKLQKLCEAKRISIAELASRCGYHPNSFYNATSRGQISKGIAEKIREVYPDISLDWLLGDSEYMNVEAYEKARVAEVEKNVEAAEKKVLAFASFASARGFSMSWGENEHGEIMWRISNRGNSPQAAECTGKMFADFYEDVCSHFDLSFKRFIEKNRVKGGGENG